MPINVFITGRKIFFSKIVLPFVISPCYSMRVWITGHPRQKEGWEKDRQTDGRMDGGRDGRTDGRTDRFPLCSTGLRPLWGHCPAPSQLKPLSTQAGHGYRWPLTAFGLLLIFTLSLIQTCFLPKSSGLLINISQGTWGDRLQDKDVTLYAVF